MRKYPRQRILGHDLYGDSGDIRYWSIGEALFISDYELSRMEEESYRRESARWHAKSPEPV
jgi:hypothetical protein